MLTPQEVQEKTFPKATFGGYNMAAVDEFLEPLSEDYIALYKENEVLRNKLRVLVDTVESYRSTEDAMRGVLANAQKTADQMVAKAKAEADDITNNAEKRASVQHADIDEGIRTHQLKLDAAKQNTVDYIGKMRRIYEEQLAFLDRLSNLEEHKSFKSAPAPEHAPVHEAPAPAEELPAGVPEAPAPEDPAPAEPENREKPPKFEFIDLQFGKEYELK